jgi:deoxyribodipyrimidine photo-lyase
MPSIMWFRRDLRLRDNPALLAAIEAARSAGDGEVLGLFVIDPVLANASGPVRREYLSASLGALDASMGGRLQLRTGDPRVVLPAMAQLTGAASVHVAADYGPYGSTRDRAVEQALGSVPLIRTGSPYAVAPGRVTKDDGTAYRVYTPFHRAWLRHGWRAPADDPGEVAWLAMAGGEALPTAARSGVTLPPAGEQAAWDRWDAFRAVGLAAYADRRDRADLAGTSSLSHHLRWGEIHPRSLLAEIGDDEGDAVFRKELCWREFYADVLWNHPRSARASLDPRFDTRMPWATGPSADDAFTAWATGCTGYPFVDAGMRQLRAEGWVHNRVRMVVASFLVKDLHLPWQRGAAEFMHWLRDADLASNAHGWQWTAGCGTDASPFYRVFNPVAQGLKFDPDGAYVRRYIPELAHLPGKAAHEPWDAVDGYAQGYPRRIVDHRDEREAALAAFATLKGA